MKQDSKNGQKLMIQKSDNGRRPKNGTNDETAPKTKSENEKLKRTG